MPKSKNIFKQTDCLSVENLKKYAAGKFTASENHKIELHLTDCEICSDIVEGFTYIAEPENLTVYTESIKKEISKKIHKPKIINFRRPFYFAAASLILLFSSYSVGTILSIKFFIYEEFG